MGMPYDAERVGQLRKMLVEARKQKLSAGLRRNGSRGSDDHAHHADDQGRFCRHRAGRRAHQMQAPPRGQRLVRQAPSGIAD